MRVGSRYRGKLKRLKLEISATKTSVIKNFYLDLLDITGNPIIFISLKIKFSLKFFSVHFLGTPSEGFFMKSREKWMGANQQKLVGT